jgi:hypothetical protein
MTLLKKNAEGSPDCFPVFWRKEFLSLTLSLLILEKSCTPLPWNQGDPLPWLNAPKYRIVIVLVLNLPILCDTFHDKAVDTYLCYQFIDFFLRKN